MDEGATKGDRMSRVYKRRQEQYITSMPSLFDYYCFIFHFPGICTIRICYRLIALCLCF